MERPVATAGTPSQAAGPALAVVIVTWRCADTIARTLEPLCRQLAPGDELVLVDNASGDGTADAAAAAAPRATVLRMSANLGFAAGCRAGAEATAAPLILFLNPDARPEDGALDALRAAATERPGWGAWQAAVTLPDGTLNSGGGVVHFLGFAWAGLLGEPLATLGDEPAAVGFASGAALTVRRPLWEALGGFDDEFFMYAEDVDLSLRMCLAGHGVGVVPTARVTHDYEFAKGERKWFLLERNRWWVLLATYPLPLLLATLPLLLATELALLAVAAAGGWLPSKLRAQWAVATSLPRALRRRSAVQVGTTVSAAAFADALVPDLSSPYLGRAGRSRLLAIALRAYWVAVRALLPGGRGRQPSADRPQ
jgi:N-acetylglucosaminyl-diphospho-decaprenol L-rhamnosyltransferase